MKRASRHFTSDQRKRIAEAVRAAEASTNAEIVPVVASCSGRYDRGEDFAGLSTAIIALVLAWTFFQHEDPSPRGWGGLPVTLDLPWLVAIVIAGYVTGMLAAMNIAWLRRLFTPRLEMIDEVDARARQAFFDQRIHHAAADSGVLIYISLFERRAAVLADCTVMQHLPAAELQTLRDALVTDLKNSDLTDAIVRAIERIGQRLADVLPGPATDGNDLADALITID